MPTDLRITEDLKRFSLEAGQFQDDCIAISNAFSNGSANPSINAGLEVLEFQLAKLKKAKTKSAMGMALAGQEKLTGINTDSNGNTVVPTLTRPLSNDAAHELLCRGKIWKDPGIDQWHGEHTHRIQWFILTSQKMTQLPPAEFLKEIGKHKTETGITASSLWDCLFDRLTTPGQDAFSDNGDDDFRCPERLNRFLMDADRFPTFKLMLRVRLNKRLDTKTLFPEETRGLEDALRKHVESQEITDAKIHVMQALPPDLMREVNRLFGFALHYELAKQGISFDPDKRPPVVKLTPPVGGDGELRKRIRRALVNTKLGYREKVFG